MGSKMRSYSRIERNWFISQRFWLSPPVVLSPLLRGENEFALAKKMRSHGPQRVFINGGSFFLPLPTLSLNSPNWNSFPSLIREGLGMGSKMRSYSRIERNWFISQRSWLSPLVVLSNFLRRENEFALAKKKWGVLIKAKFGETKIHFRPWFQQLSLYMPKSPLSSLT